MKKINTKTTINANSLQNCSYVKLKLNNRFAEIIFSSKFKPAFIGARGSVNIRAANSI